MMVYLKMGWLIVIVIGLMKRIYVSIRFEIVRQWLYVRWFGLVLDLKQLILVRYIQTSAI